MNDPMSDENKPLDPETTHMVAKVRRLMMIASATTFVAVGVVLAVIGYRVFKAEGSAPPVSDLTVSLPAGTKVLSTAIGEGRIAVTVELRSMTEVHLFDLKTLKPLGTIRLAPK
jgi:hypothetical protein